MNLPLKVEIPDGLPLWVVEMVILSSHALGTAAALRTMGEERGATTLAGFAMRLLTTPEMRKHLPRPPQELLEMHFQITAGRVDPEIWDGLPEN